MRLNRTVAALLGAASLALFPSTAVAANKVKVYAPPGKAGTSEYSEIVPSAGGNTLPPVMGGGNPTEAQISKLGSGKVGVRRLAKLGKQGAAAAQFAQQTAPATVPGGRKSKSSSLSPAPGGSALSGLTHLLGGSDVDGIGLVLPLALAFGLGWAGAMALFRTRRRHDPGASQP